MQDFSDRLSLPERFQVLFLNPAHSGLCVSPIIFFPLDLPLWWSVSIWYERVMIVAQRTRAAVHAILHGNVLVRATTTAQGGVHVIA